MQILNDREELQEAVSLALKMDVPFIEIVLCVAASLDVPPRVAAFMVHHKTFELSQPSRFVGFLLALTDKFEAMHPERLSNDGRIPKEEFTNFVVRGTWR